MLVSLFLACVVGVALALLLLYANLLASIGVLRDRELPRSTRLLRLAFLWCVPLLGAVMALRVTSEESPHYLPSRRWWCLFLPLLSDRHPRFTGDPVIDVAGEAAQSLPGQVGDLNVGKVHSGGASFGE